MIQFRAAALADIGRVRRRNEDRLIYNEKLNLFGVADGVGGLPGGAEAAELVLLKVSHALANSPNQHPDLTQIVQDANLAVYELGRKLSPGTGIGSTLTIGQIRERNLLIGHVGDSRCYTLRGGHLSALTSDHSVENEIRDRRARGEDVYFHESNRHALTRCMGQPGTVEVDVITHAIQARDRYLFCTDGVSGLVNDEELADLMARDEDPETVLRDIITQAIRHGGNDNATGVLVYIDSVA
jgi:serine/threonine protein phosphatase PrpC